MASEFIGYNVLVTLREPPNAQLRGEVANVVGQCLMLRHVNLLWSGQHLATYSVEAADIADLSVETHDRATSPYGSSAQQKSRAGAPKPAHDAARHSFVDPAIVSFSKPSTRQPTRPGAPAQTSTYVSSLTNVQGTVPNKTFQNKPVIHNATLSEPFSNLELDVDKQTAGLANVVNHGGLDGAGSTEQRDITSTPDAVGSGDRNVRRDRRNNLQQVNSPDAGTGIGRTEAGNASSRGKGWRQTAFVEPAEPQISQLPHPQKSPNGPANSRRRKNKGRKNFTEDTNGWATEDATDIQEMGDFDFEANLSKFDKRRVFEEIRNDDFTAEEERLVYFNRKARPGTNGGKYLHWTENVLESPEKSDAGESDQDVRRAKLSSVELSRTSTRAQESHKGSVNSGLLIVPQMRKQLSMSRTSSPRRGKQSQSASPINAPTGTSGGTFKLTTTNRSCPAVSPLQFLEVEQLAVTELGLSEDILTENAGRGISEAAVSMLPNDAAAPTILLLTGNHRTGARAVVAARHLRNRGHRVTLCMLGLEHENELLDICRKQLEIFRKIGGRVLRWEELSARISTSNFGTDLIIDALFGIHIAFDDLRTEKQAVAFEMISWANRSNVEILSVDVPSGVSATNGEIAMVEGSRLCIMPTSIVCLGAPKTGIFNALVNGEGSAWHIIVADIGIPQVVWRKYGTRRRHGIDFGNRWLAAVRFHPSSA